jgi:hypothetical protein
MDYTSLISDMKTYMLRTDPPYVTKIPDLIQQGIIRVYNNAKDLGFEITLNVNAIQTNQSIINKPGNWRETISIQMIDLQNNSIFLLPRSLEFCRTYWPNVNLTAQPKYYSDMVPNLNNANLDNTYGNSNWFIAPTTDQVYNFVIIYLGIPLFNADNSTNFLTQRYPDLLLYSCLIEACLFLDNEEKRNKYDTMFSKELETINNMNRNRSTDRTVIRENN